LGQCSVDLPKAGSSLVFETRQTGAGLAADRVEVAADKDAGRGALDGDCHAGSAGVPVDGDEVGGHQRVANGVG
jgi:hypothetical protein